MTNSLSIPKELVHPFFYNQDEQISLNYDDSLQLEPLFLYEAAFFNNIPAKKPWEDPFVYIPLLLEKWTELNNQLEQLFTLRNREEALPLMKQGIGLFIQFLYWINCSPVILNPNIDYEKLSICPINLSERLQFVMTRPTVHHAYMQLKELFAELEKSYRKEEALAKFKQ